MTPKQQRFVEEYLLDLNATQAAIRAGYSAKTANRIASEMLSKPDMAAAIAAAQQARSQRTQIDADWVLRRLANEAEADMADLYDDGGNLLPIREWPTVFRRGLVVGFETVHEVEGKGEDARRLLVRKIKLQDRTKTVELIGRHVNVQAFKDRLEVEDVTDRAEQMRRARAKRLGQA